MGPSLLISSWDPVLGFSEAVAWEWVWERMSGCVSDRKVFSIRNWLCVCTHRYMCMDIFYKGLAHILVQASKSHDVHGKLASWNPGEPMMQSWLEGWSARDPGIANVSAWAQRQEKADVLVRRPWGRKKSLLRGVASFCSIQDINWVDEARPHWEQSILLSFLI